jgi:hypothetical protein
MRDQDGQFLPTSPKAHAKAEIQYDRLAATRGGEVSSPHRGFSDL